MFLIVKAVTLVSLFKKLMTMDVDGDYTYEVLHFFMTLTFLDWSIQKEFL